jgi:hypothetical protein
MEKKKLLEKDISQKGCRSAGINGGACICCYFRQARHGWQGRTKTIANDD